jgi:hypothetical protein
MENHLKRIVIHIFLFLSVLNVSLFADINSGLVAHYKFDDNLNDSIGSNNGTASNGTLPFSIGKHGKALDLSGTSEYVKLTSAPLTGTTPYTLVVWAKNNQTTIGSYSGLVQFGTTSTNQLVRLDLQSNTSLFASWWSTESAIDASSAFTNGGAFNDDKWHMIVSQWDGNTTHKVWVDNVEVSSLNWSGLNIVDTVANAMIGKTVNSSFTGLIDDVRIYNRALSSTDINELFNYSAPKLTLKNHGGVVQFNDNSSQIQPSTQISVGTDHTIEFWINTTDVDKRIVGIYGSTPWSKVAIDANGRLLSQLAVDSSNSNNLSSNTMINDGLWHHVAMTYKSDGNVSIYIDKTLDNSYLTATVSSVILNNATLIMGHDSNNETAKMQLDEVRIWNTTRTQADINATVHHQLDGNEIGLVAYYNFDERVGDKIVDIAGSDLNATIDGNITRLNFLGDGLSFDGDNDYVGISSFPNIDLTSNNISVSAWLKVSTTQADTISRVINHGNSTGYTLWLTNGQAHFSLLNGGAVTAVSTTNIQDNNWHYVTSIFDGSNIKIYIDGVEEQSVFIGSFTPPSANNDTLKFATNHDGSQDFNGTISQVSIWNKALSQEEIKQNMHSIPDISDSSLLGYWPFNEGAGSNTYDRSSNSNNGTITDATWTKTAPNIFGNKIYTSQNVATMHKLVVENNTTTPTFSYNGGVPNEVKDFNETTGTFGYITSNISNSPLQINANDGGNTLSSSFDVVVYESNISGAITIDLNLSNINLSDNNITAINYIGENNNSESFPIAGTQNLVDGNNSIIIQVNNSSGDFSLQFILDNNSSTYWYNFTDNKLYTTKGSNSDFIRNASNISSINLNASSSNWVASGSTPTLTLKAHGGALQFDGTGGNYVQVPDNDILDPANITVEAWYFKPPTGVGKIVNKWDNINNSLGYTLQINADSTAGFYIHNGSSYKFATSTTNLQDNQWYHLAGTYDGSNIKILVNGVEENTTAHSGTINNSTANLQINTYTDPQVSGKGVVDEVRIWNTALTQEQINTNKHTQLNGNETNLIAYYNFDERMGNKFYDITSNNLDGTIDGNITRLNFLGDNLYFDGTDDNITAPASSSLNSITNAISFTGWAKIEENNATVSDALLVYGESVNAHVNAVESFIFEHRDNTGLRFRLQDGHNSNFVDVYDANNSISAKKNQWYYIAFTWSSSSQMGKIYVNGKLRYSESTASGNIAYSSNPKLLIGKWYGQERFSKGNIKNFSLWNKELSETQIKTIMYSSPNINDSSLVAYWPMNEGNGTTIYDRSQNNNHGTIMGPTWQNDAPTIYGNTIYSEINVSSETKIHWENFNNTPSITMDNNVSAPVILNDKTIIYTPDNTDPDTLTFTANDGTNNISTNINFKSYNINSSTSNEFLHLRNITEFSSLSSFDNNTSQTRQIPYSVRFVTLKHTSTGVPMYVHEQDKFETNGTITSYTYYDSTYPISDKEYSDKNYTIDTNNIISIKDKYGTWADVKIIGSINNTDLIAKYTSYGHNINFQGISKADIGLLKYAREEFRLFGYDYSDDNGTNYNDIANFITSHQSTPFFKSEINNNSYLIFGSNSSSGTIHEVDSSGTIITGDIGTYTTYYGKSYLFESNNVEQNSSDPTDVVVITLNNNTTNYFEKRLAYGLNHDLSGNVQKGEYYAKDEVEKHLFLNKAAKDSIHNYFVKVPADLNFGLKILSKNQEFTRSLPTNINGQTVTYNGIESRDTSKATVAFLDNNQTLKINTLDKEGFVTIKLTSTDGTNNYRQYVTAKITSSITIDLNISGLETKENIDSITLIGDDNETIIFDPTNLQNQTTNIVSSSLSNTNQQYVLQVRTKDSQIWLYNFDDNKLYKSTDSTNFKFNLNGQDSISISLAPSQWVEENPKPKAVIYDYYKLKGFDDFYVDINISDPNKDSLRYKLTIASNDIITNSTDSSFSSYIPYDTYSTQTVKILINKKQDSNNTGIIKCQFTVNDGTSDFTETFFIIVNDYISIQNKPRVSQAEFNTHTSSLIDFNNTKIYSTQEDIYKKYNDGANLLTVNSYNFENNEIFIYQVIDKDQEIIATKALNSMYYKQEANNTISIFDDPSLSAASKIKEIKYIKDINHSAMSSAYQGVTFDSNDKGYIFYEKYLKEQLYLYADVKYDGSTYSSLDNLIEEVTYGETRNSMGIVRSERDTSKLLLLDSGSTQGQLIELDQNGTITTSNKGTWAKQSYNGKNILVLYPSSTLYNYGTAFVLDDSNTSNIRVKRGQYFKSGDITASIYLNKSAMEKFTKHFSPKPHITKTINTGWTYIGLPSSMTVCDSSIQSILQNICNQEHTLESIFGTNTNIQSLLKYTSGWTYWDKNDTINEYYQLDKFSAISASDGVLVKSSGYTDIDLPYDMFNNNTQEFINLNANDWMLASATEDKTVQEIQTMVESQGKTLKYILVLRKKSLNEDEWLVYAPTNDESVNNTITRLAKVNKDESFWIFTE